MHIFPACLGCAALLRAGAAWAVAAPDTCSLLQSLVHDGHAHAAVAPWPPTAPKPVAVAPEVEDVSKDYQNELESSNLQRRWRSYLTNVADIYLALDTDKNKMVSMQEFVKVFKEDVWSDAIVLGRLVDKSGDDQISVDEFRKWLTQVPDVFKEKRMPMLPDALLTMYMRTLADAFFVLDIDMDKSLTLQELSTLFNAALWKQATIGVLLDLVDGNGDRGLDFLEFRSWFVGDGITREPDPASLVPAAGEETGANFFGVVPSEAAPSEADITYSPVEPSETALGANASAAPPAEEETVVLSDADFLEPSEAAAPGSNDSAAPAPAAVDAWEEEAEEWDKTMSSRAEAATYKDMTWEEEAQTWNDWIRKHKDEDIAVKEPANTESWDKEAAEWDEEMKARQEIHGKAEAQQETDGKAEEGEQLQPEESELEEPELEPEPEEPAAQAEDTTAVEPEGRKGRRRRNKKEGANEGNGTGFSALDDQGAAATTEEEEENATNCADKEPTGFKVNGWTVPCMALARECENPIFSETLQITCPMTCGRCFQLKVEAAAKESKAQAKAREEREAATKQAAAVAEAKAIADSLADAENAAVDNLKKQLEKQDATTAEEERKSSECKDVDDEHTGFSTEEGGPVSCKDLVKYCNTASFSVQIQSACPAACKLCKPEVTGGKTDRKRRRYLRN